MNLTAVLDLLRERTGIDPDTLGAGAVPAAVRARLHRIGERDAAAYACRLRADAAEFARLVDEVVVPETWFFRGGDLFWHLADHVRAAAAPVRVLSLPCSTGEEPYSLAIALTERGVPPARWSIEAVDLSGRHVEQARRGVYRAFSFRQLPTSLRDRYFSPAGDDWQLSPAIRTAVQFRVGNILEPALLGVVGPFDLVFCRNLFIYLGRDARRRAVDTVAGLVRDGGLLCLGHADPLDPADGRFAPTGPPAYFPTGGRGQSPRRHRHHRPCGWRRRPALPRRRRHPRSRRRSLCRSTWRGRGGWPTPGVTTRR
ncbi:MAG: protein-glutamate O-methyltransferase CheR [Gemmataceae bacterium]